MKLQEIMENHFDGLSLTPDFYHQWNIGIHLELGNHIYQFDDNNRLNMERFNTIYVLLFLYFLRKWMTS